MSELKNRRTFETSNLTTTPSQSPDKKPLQKSPLKEKKDYSPTKSPTIHLSKSPLKRKVEDCETPNLQNTRQSGDYSPLATDDSNEGREIEIMSMSDTTSDGDEEDQDSIFYQIYQERKQLMRRHGLYAFDECCSDAATQVLIIMCLAIVFLVLYSFEPVKQYLDGKVN